MDGSFMAELDAQYRLLREECGFLSRPDDGLLEVSGADAADYLQGQLTNDVESPAPGEAVYAALLERKAQIQADMDVLRLEQGKFLLHTEADALAATRGHLEMYKIGREVDVIDRSAEFRVISLIGPGCESKSGIRSGAEMTHQRVRIGDSSCRALTRPIGEIPALNLIVEIENATTVEEALDAEGIPEVSSQAVEILRVEAGLPRFGHEITAERMPAEAGIVDRAISFTKGCYIGQEPVARLHYRGRPNRQLRFLELSESYPPGTSLELDGKPIGELTSSVLSPARGPIGLAILRREAEPGSSLDIAGGRAGGAKVGELPPSNGDSA